MTELAPDVRPVLLLPGQGGQYPRMAAGLYGREPAFTTAMDELFALLGAFGEEVRADWLAAEPRVPLDHVTRSQVLIFAVDYALGRLLLSWGVRPAALLGHSMGEVAAATLAGVFDLRTAAHLVRDRVEQLAVAPRGGMVAVAATPEQLRPYAQAPVAVAALNGPRRTILAGPAEPLARVTAQLRADGFVVRNVPATTPFHSPAVRPYAAASLPYIATLPRRAPALPLYSGYTGGPMPAERAVSAEFWALQPAETVYFWTALDALLTAPWPGSVVVVETGPGDMLSAAAYAHPSVLSGRATVLTLLPPRLRDGAAELASVHAAGRRLRELGAVAGHFPAGEAARA